MELVDESHRPRLATDPLAAIPDTYNLSVELLPEGDKCPLHGAYFSQNRAVAVVNTASQGRVRFSALHELGHHLIGESGIRLDLGDYDDPAAAEESVCDEFAAAILLPDELIDQHIPAEGPEARNVVALWEASPASRAATCVAAARRLPSSGYVMLTDLDANALFTAVNGSQFRVRADTPQGDGSAAAKAVRHNGKLRGTGPVTFSTGSTSQAYQVDAVVSGDYVFAVFVLTNAPWARISWIEPSTRRLAARPCQHCGEPFERFPSYWCDHCSQHGCPHCGRCGCSHVEREELRCERCFLTKPGHLIVDGICIDCR